MAAVVTEALPAGQWSERLCSASTVIALGPDSHSLLSVGFACLTRRTMNENYGSFYHNVVGCEIQELFFHNLTCDLMGVHHWWSINGT